MNNREIRRRCEDYLKQWDISTPEQKASCMSDLYRLKEEYLQELGKVVIRAQAIDILIDVLKHRVVNSPVPEVFLKAFGESNR